MTLTRKASQAGAVMLVGIVMQMSGFVSGQKVQPAEVSHTILMILSVGTLLVLFCGFLVSLSFRLNLQTHSTLRGRPRKCVRGVMRYRNQRRRTPAPLSRCWPVCRMRHCGVITTSVI